MTYFLRKISRAKWPNDPLSDIEEEAKIQVMNVQADAITNCIKTSSNKLSLWEVSNPSFSIDDALPLILGFDKASVCDVIYIDGEILKKEGITLERSENDANIRLLEYKKFHYNALVNNYEGLGSFAKIILKCLGTYKRFTKAQVKDKIKLLISSGTITKQDISDSLYSSLKIETTKGNQ